MTTDEAATLDELARLRGVRDGMINALAAVVRERGDELTESEINELLAVISDQVADTFFARIDALESEIVETEAHQRTRQLRADTRDFQRRVL